MVVTTSGGQASAGIDFDVTSAPTGPIISKLEPDSGPAGTEIKIKGLNFGEDAGTVTFNGVTASQINWTDTKIRVTVPATATSGPVVVGDGRWGVEQWGHLHRDHRGAGHLQAGTR